MSELKGIRVDGGWVLGVPALPPDELNGVFEDLERHGFRVVRAEVVGDTLFIRIKRR